MRWDNLVENTREAGTGTLFAADAVTTRTFDTAPTPGMTEVAAHGGATATDRRVSTGARAPSGVSSGT